MAKIKSNGERPTDPPALLSRLQALFPLFGRDELAGEVQSGEGGFHWIMLHFSSEFRATDADEAQLDGLARLIEQAVARDDELENGMSTCFLEHLHQIDRGDILYRRLSRQAKAHAKA